ncbi:MAG: class I SAM-dependent methyltransferase [Azonexus sp.]
MLSLENGIWVGARGFRPERFAEARRDHLSEISETHFWFDARARLITRILDSLPLSGRAAALEIGCGSGGFLPVLRARFGEVVGVDAYESSLREAVRCEPKAVPVQADAHRIPLAAGQFDLIVALDVLEHLEPEKFFAEAARLVRPGGFLLLSVPAFPLLWGDADVRAGHRCRYRRRHLVAEIAQHGWAPLGTAYYQCLLFGAMLLSRRLARGGISSVERQPPAWMGRLFAAVNRAELLLLGRHAPFGTSLIAWAQRS